MLLSSRAFWYRSVAPVRHRPNCHTPAPAVATATSLRAASLAPRPVLRLQAASSSQEPLPDRTGDPDSQHSSTSSQQQTSGAESTPQAAAAAAEGGTGPMQEQQEQRSAQSQPLPSQEASSQPDVAQPGSSPLPDATGSAGAGSLGGLQQSSGAGAAAVGGGGGGGGGPSAVTLLSRFNGVGYTFVLAGFLKIMTVGGLALSAPTDVARTAFGKATPYLMLPVGLGMCWVAKQVVDTGLNESKRFLQYLFAGLVVLYFALVKLMYKYEPQADWVRRPRPRMPGQMAELRAQLGDRELLAASDMDSSRFYAAEKPGSKELYDDVAWYEGRYPSQLAAPGQQQRRGAARRAALAVTDTEEEYSTSADVRPRVRTAGSGGAEPARRSFLGDNTR